MNEQKPDFAQLVGRPESEELEYKAVLPPSRTIAQLICGFANSNGGVIILGVSDSPHGIEVKGLSEDFHANSITHKALDLISPIPQVEYQYFTFDAKKLYGIRVFPSLTTVVVEGKLYRRMGAETVQQNIPSVSFTSRQYPKIQQCNDQIAAYNEKGTSVKLGVKSRI